MARVYDNWERLVRATLRREELRITGQRTPSDVSLASLSSSSSFSFSSSSRRFSSFNFPTSLLVGDSFTYHQILQATGYLSQSNLINNGHTGDLFYGVLEDGIQEVLVKKVDLSSSNKESFLISELEFFGKVSHSRLVPLMGHCMENMKDKFLVYKYMPYKDLSSSLFKKNIPEHNYDLVSLDWITRLKIAIGVAEGLCYLHHDCDPPLVHRDIQARSILLDDKFEVRLGSLAEVCEAEEKRDGRNKIARLLRLPKGPGQGTTGKPNATCSYDVYCLGKVLLELVTGYLGFSAAAKEKESTMKDWMANTLPNISIYDMELVVKIVDPTLLIDEDLLMEVWAVAIIAKACLNPQPSMRPRMMHVLKALENPLKMVAEGDGGSAKFSDTTEVEPQISLPRFSGLSWHSPGEISNYKI